MKVVKEIFDHILHELGLSTIFLSIQSANHRSLLKAHDSIHEFLYLAGLCLPPNTSWHRHSAFLFYHYAAYIQAHRSLYEALAGCYNSANILLRGVLEGLIKGALLECLAHKEFRENAKVIEKKVKASFEIEPSGPKEKKTILDWIEEQIKAKPCLETELEEISLSIFDRTSRLPEDREFRRLIPSPYVITQQLAEWGKISPFSCKEIYEIYGFLSSEVHVIPEKIDIGRRLLREKVLFDITVIPEELESYLNLLHKIMDVGIVLELNMLSDWISQYEVKKKLKERLGVLRDLELEKSFQKLSEVVG